MLIYIETKCSKKSLKKESMVKKGKSKRPRINEGTQQLRPRRGDAQVVFSMKNRSSKKSKKEHHYKKRRKDPLWCEIAGMFTSFGRLSVS